MEAIDTKPKPAPRLLIVDDDELVGRVLVRVLRGKGYEPTLARDGRHASELLATGFDLVLTDVNMPNLDGIGLLRLVREQDPDLPVIMFAGSPSTDAAIGALRLRATAFLTKPIEPAVLLEEVDRALKMYELARLRQQAHQLVNANRDSTVTLTQSFERGLAELFMVYQPIVSWVEKSVFGYEALVRTREPSLPHPGAFFDAASRLDRDQDIGRAIRATCAGVVPSLHPSAAVFVNLHARDLLDESLYDTTSALTALAPRIVLELTERAQLEAVPDVEERVGRLRSAGFRIAIDDIGAGYSGLNSFALLRPDLVKLDMALVRDIDKDPVRFRVARLLVELCKGMGIATVGEGIETVAERDALSSIGCDLLQGYLFGRPVPVPAVPSFG
jgi:EAL domain-containing protein (putative c-di-GMP-specific phosphodiesterase class I)